VTVHTSRQSGFSLIELMISMSIMLLIAGAATTALMKMASAQATIWNRTQMHSGIRGATEVLQQEVGQAGRLALPSPNVTLAAGIAAGTRTVAVYECPTTTACTTASVGGLFQGQRVQVDAGCSGTQPTCASNEEIVTLTGVNLTTKTITAVFLFDHASGAPIQARGVFASGVVPPAASPSSYTNGSTGTVLKLYGDINADGSMVYVEYSCVIPAPVGGVQSPGNLYRNSMAWDATGGSPAPAASQILLSNIMPNPDGSACFTYQTVGVSVDTDLNVTSAPVMTYFVTDVAVTLTVQTQLIDPVTKRFQTETKALLNVSPRNVFNAWTLASLGMASRIQPIPPSVALLLP
jgi:prepilin-type N-terminal cleavage/methylation domain-containing protein